MTELDRFLEKYVTDGNGCWNWTGARDPNGYGVFTNAAGKHKISAHRFAYLAFNGPLDELHVDHLCRNRACVNPAHLDAVTPRENLMRGETVAARNAAKTHCASGHEFTEANTYTTPDGRRNCKVCLRAATHRYRQRAER